MDRSILIFLAIVIVAVVVVLLWFVRNRDKNPIKVDIGGQTPQATGGEGESTEKGFKRRLLGLGIFSGTIFGVLWARLWSMQLVGTDEYAEQAELNRTRSVTSPAPRGRILDRNGVELVTNRPSLAVVATADVLENEREMHLLANLLGMPYMAVRRNIQNATEGVQSNRTVAVDVSRAAVAYIEEHPDLFEGITIEERSQRAYPNGSLASHVLGYTGPVTSEQLEAVSDDRAKITYESGDVVGQAGVEYQYEDVLQGIRGERQVYVNAAGDVTGVAAEIEPVRGSDVTLTIDAKIQKAAEEGLEHAITASTALASGGPGRGACLALDVTNGEILAMASAPTFEPSVFVGGIATADWEQLNDEKSGYPLLNRCVSGTYPSASTIKPLSSFAAFDSGVSTIGSVYNCPGFWTGFGEAAGQYCWNHSGHGAMDMRSGIVYSCDSVFYEIGKAIFYSDTPEALQAKFRQWHLGSTTGVDLPSEAEGRIPDAQWKWDYFSSWSDEDRVWHGGDTTNLVIGQGDMLVTPLQMACVYMAIANGGTIWTPHVMKEVANASASGSVLSFEPKSVTIDESTEYLDFAKDALEGVIYEEDYAVTSHFSNLPVSVAGKTGTAERQGYENSTGWFVAYAPADDPKYLVAAVIEEGGFGSTSAMYAVRDVLGAIYDTPDTSDAVSSVGAR